MFGFGSRKDASGELLARVFSLIEEVHALRAELNECRKETYALRKLISHENPAGRCLVPNEAEAERLAQQAGDAAAKKSSQRKSQAQRIAELKKVYGDDLN